MLAGKVAGSPSQGQGNQNDKGLQATGKAKVSEAPRGAQENAPFVSDLT